MSIISDNIKYIRKNIFHGESQEKFAQRLGLNGNIICNFEKGRTPPSHEMLEKIAKLINISTDQLTNQDLSMLPFPNYAISYNQSKVFNKAYYPLLKPSSDINSTIFNRAYTLAREYKDTLDTNIIEDALYHFQKAADIENIDEAKVNFISLVLEQASYQYLPDDFELDLTSNFSNGISSDKINAFLGSISHFDSNNWDEVQKWYYSKYNPSVIKYMKDLKSTQYSDLCDFFMYIKYVNGMVESIYPRQMLNIVAQEMFISLLVLENKYALKLSELFISELL